MPWHAILTVLGLGCQIVGLTWIVVDVSRARAEEFGEYGLVRRIGRWFAYWLFEQPPSPDVHLSGASVSGQSSLTGNLTASPETEMQQVQRELRQLAERMERHERQVAADLATANNRVQAVADELAGRVSEVETRQRSIRRAALRGEVRGAKLFIVGAVLSATPQLI